MYMCKYNACIMNAVYSVCRHNKVKYISINNCDDLRYRRSLRKSRWMCLMPRCPGVLVTWCPGDVVAWSVVA